MRRLLIVLAMLAGACRGAEGPVGPTGPQGPQGPQGPTGPQGNPGSSARLFTATITANGTVIKELSPLPDSYTVPPAMTCYLSTDIPGVWVAVSDGYSETTPYCLVFYDTGTQTWNAMMLQAPAGATAAFVVVF